MPRILTICPTTGETVPTGHRTPEVDLTAMAAPLSFRCRACQEVHSWSTADAKVEEAGPLDVFGRLAMDLI